MIKKINYKKLLLPIAILLVIFNFYSAKSLFDTEIAQAQMEGTGEGTGNPTPPTTPPANFSLGEIIGYAWGATTDVPYGGVGWINFNCKTQANPNCSQWGVHLKPDLTDPEDEKLTGELTGYAWSQNFGWLSFNASDTTSCFVHTSNPDYQITATVDFEAATSDIVDMKGWAKFISADEAGDNSGGWDGCVSFRGGSATNSTADVYGVTVTNPSGELNGYAWGSDVAGWIAFDCNGCDTHVVLGTGHVSLSSSNTSVAPGGGTTLTWNTENVSSCTSYSNSNNYSHWKSTTPRSPTSIGLPNGSHLITGGINTTTTYTLRCKNILGEALAPASVTVNVVTILGCTNSAAYNFDPEATEDDGSCELPPSLVPNLSLVATPASLPLGGANNNVNFVWSSNNPTAFTGTCSGSVTKGSGALTSVMSVTGWSGSGLPLPDSSKVVNLTNAMSGANAGDQFTFRISCTSPEYGVKTAQTTVSTTAESGVCTDPRANNTGRSLPCTYGAPLIDLSLTAPSVIVVNSGSPSVNYPATLNWNSNRPQDFVGTCVGAARFRHAGQETTINVPGWTNANPALAKPPSSKNINLASWANIAESGDYIKFSIRCSTASSGPRSDDAIVSFQVQAPPPPPAPNINLQIIAPNNPESPSAGYEIVPQGGVNPFTLQWTAENVSSCVASNDMYSLENSISDNPSATGDLTPNQNWISPINLTGPNTTSFAIADSTINNTIFHMDCIPEDPYYGTLPIRVDVCMRIDGRDFPQCPMSLVDGNPPTYQEI